MGMRTIDITCKGCWRIVALGISYRTHTELFMKDGEVVARAERHYPSHGEEECPECGAVHDCGPPDFEENALGKLTSTEYAREREPGEFTRFRYRGFIEGPITVNDPVHDLPEDDLLEEQWLE